MRRRRARLVGIEVPGNLFEPAARYAADDSRDPGAWPVHYKFMRDLLLLPDEDQGVSILAPESRERLGATVRILGKYVREFVLTPAGANAVGERTLSAPDLANLVRSEGLPTDRRLHVVPDLEPGRRDEVEPREEPDVEGTGAVDDAWERIERHVGDLLRPGVPEEDVAAAERGMDVTLPDAFRHSLRRHDGEVGDAWVVDDEYRLLPIREIVEDHADRRVKLASDAKEFDAHWWRVEWIPFASDIFGNALVIDVRDGSVRFWVHDTPEREREARRFEGWLARWADELDDA